MTTVDGRDPRSESRTYTFSYTYTDFEFFGLIIQLLALLHLRLNCEHICY
jgi:hypothetical protein